jgi:hypothetical protein
MGFWGVGWGKLITSVGSIVLTFVVDNSLEIRVRDLQQVLSNLFLLEQETARGFQIVIIGSCN